MNLRKEIAEILADNFDLRASLPLGCDPVGELEELFRSWASGMVKKVKGVNESNGRYNACAEMQRLIEETNES